MSKPDSQESAWHCGRSCSTNTSSFTKHPRENYSKSCNYSSYVNSFTEPLQQPEGSVWDLLINHHDQYKTAPWFELCLECSVWLEKNKYIHSNDKKEQNRRRQNYLIFRFSKNWDPNKTKFHEKFQNTIIILGAKFSFYENHDNIKIKINWKQNRPTDPRFLLFPFPQFSGQPNKGKVPSNFKIIKAFTDSVTNFISRFCNWFNLISRYQSFQQKQLKLQTVPT